ncbi:MAG TPA: hypothetical protein VJN43_22595 [Bryobacteraceae bacterium]|nr:hypothetical protein [Bryobacteraceae bacterium]
MSVDRIELNALLDQIPEADLPVTRKLLGALAAAWDVAPVGSEGELTEQARNDLDTAEAFFDANGKGVPHKQVLKEFDF